MSSITLILMHADNFWNFLELLKVKTFWMRWWAERECMGHLENISWSQSFSRAILREKIEQLYVSVLYITFIILVYSLKVFYFDIFLHIARNLKFYIFWHVHSVCVAYGQFSSQMIKMLTFKWVLCSIWKRLCWKYVVCKITQYCIWQIYFVHNLRVLYVEVGFSGAESKLAKSDNQADSGSHRNKNSLNLNLI